MQTATASPSDLIPLLQKTQSKHGFVSRAEMTRIAKQLGIPVSRVFGVATFYNQFRFAPPGEHIIEVCRGTACHVKQSLILAQHLERSLKLDPEGNSPDGKFTVATVACLGACSMAPVLKVDGTFYDNLTTESLQNLVESVEDKSTDEESSV